VEHWIIRGLSRGSKTILVSSGYADAAIKDSWNILGQLGSSIEREHLYPLLGSS
jgi:hypothetical protein